MSKVRRVYAGPFEPPELVVVGAASRDAAASDGRGWRLGGAVTYCALTAARLGLRVGALMGVDREASEAAELELLDQAGVALRRVELANGPVFENLEHGGRRRQRWLSKSDGVEVGWLPEEWRGAAAWLLVPVAGEVGEEWAGVPGADGRVAVGWQGMLRRFAADGRVERVAPGPSALLRRAGVVCASRDDVAAAEDRDLRRLAPEAAIVLTEGARGGLALDPDGGSQRYQAIAAEAVDPTGAGDVFMAALAVSWLRGAEPASLPALRFAAAAASCAVEGLGIEGAPWAAQAVARLARLGDDAR